jgi:hypothetical protein
MNPIQLSHARRWVLACLLLAAAVFHSCTYEQPVGPVSDDTPPPAGGPVCDTLSPITYNNQVRAILAANCYECHSSQIQTAGVILDTYSGVKARVDGGLIPGVIRRSPGFKRMPFNRPQLDECSIRTIEKWVAAGAPNN